MLRRSFRVKMQKIESLRNTRYMQYLSALTATLCAASGATYVSWSSPALPQLTSEHSPIGTTVTDEEGSWVVSSYPLGVIQASFISAFTIEKLGRRTVLLLTTIPLFFPWIAVIYAKSTWVLVLARFIAGFGGAIIVIVIPVYIGEIAEKDIRGKLGITFAILRLSGHLFVLSVGPFISYQALGWCCSVFPLVFVTLFFFMPESPYYLVKVGKHTAARNNLLRLSRNATDEKLLDDRLREISDTVDCDMKNNSTLWELLSKREYRRSVTLMFAIKTFQQFSGMVAITAYTQTIIQSSQSSISPEISSIICGFIQIVAVLAASGLVDKLGRKPLFFASCLGCAVALVGEGVYFYLQDVVRADVSSLSWLPTTGLVMYLVMNSIGLYTLPYVLLGELFATNIKDKAVSAAGFYGSFSAFLVSKFFKPLSNAWGMYTMFWIFAGICTVGALFACFILPETKGKTFREIQEKLNKDENVGGSRVHLK